MTISWSGGTLRPFKWALGPFTQPVHQELTTPDLSWHAPCILTRRTLEASHRMHLLWLTAILLYGGCQVDFPDDRAFAPAVEEGTLFPVSVHRPSTLGVADTRRLDVNGVPIGVPCATCHKGDAPFADQAAAEEFHSTVELQHGELTCGSCHDQEERSRLHLADGTPLEFHDVRMLCAQCHGVQHRDYVRGSHGGMNGYWDLRRGPRDRNHCVDCHAPHAPAHGQVHPVLPPRDRYLPQLEHVHGGHHE